MQQHPGEFEPEQFGVIFGGEITVVRAGLAVDRDNPVDELAQRPFPHLAAHRTAEILGGDDVGGVDRPLLRKLDAALLEVDRSVAPVGHDDVTALPADLVVGMHTFGGVDPFDDDSGADSRLARGVATARCRAG